MSAHTSFRTVRFRFYGQAVGSEYASLPLPSLQIVIQRLFADLATHPRFPVLSPEHYDTAYQNKDRVRHP